MDSTSPAKKKKKRRPVPGWAVGLGAEMFRLLRRTWRITVTDRAGFFPSADPWPFIGVLWHNRIPLLMDFFPPALERRSAALASASGDGDVAARILRQFGYQVVRGSSSRGGREALYGLREKLLEGCSLALTVDGPRGPRYHVHPGAVLLAEMTGIPIVPIGFNAPRRWELGGWDRTHIPKPFSRVEFVLGAPIQIAPDLTPEQRQAECDRVRHALLGITDDARLGMMLA